MTLENLGGSDEGMTREQARTAVAVIASRYIRDWRIAGKPDGQIRTLFVKNGFTLDQYYDALNIIVKGGAK